MDTKQMNELLVIGSSCLRADFWDLHGANIATNQKEMCGERLFRRSTEKKILGRDYSFSAILLSVMDLGNADKRKA